MGTRLRTLLAGLALGLVACGTGFQEEALEALPTLAPTGMPSEAPAAANGDVLSAGRLAYVGGDGNIYVLAAGGGEPLALTDDASALGGVAYDAPTWSRGGWLSYLRAEVGPDQALQRALFAIQPGDLDTRRQLYETATGVYEYAYWAPAACDQGADCGRVAFLIAGAQAHELHLAQVSSDSQDVEERVLADGAPFYYSWAPDGERMLWFREGERLEVANVGERDGVTRLPDVPGLFQAPWWSPVDERLLFASGGEGGNALVVAEGDERLGLTEEGGTLTAFAWSPDGRHLAYVQGDAPQAYPFTSLRVLSGAGDDEGVLTEDDLVLAFFWSPDSQQIASVTVALAPGASEQASLRTSGSAAPARQDLVLAWNVADVSSGQSRELTRFTPTASELYIFRFFDQFAQSHNVWSPDSSQIVYAEILPGGRQVINLLNVGLPASDPAFVSEGQLAVFSFD